MNGNSTAETNQYLTCTLGNELYALDISSVREVLELSEITPIPQTPAYMRGVINLRGRAVPVVDMRLKFSLADIRDTVETCIIITEVDMGGEEIPIGALVDSVCEVAELPPDSLEAPPRTGADTAFIKGMGRSGERFVMVLDIDKVFAEADAELFRQAAREEPDEPAGA